MTRVYIPVSVSEDAGTFFVVAILENIPETDAQGPTLGAALANLEAKPRIQSIVNNGMELAFTLTS